ncbi:MAG: demethoxyubiquinone hydroxylase family protein [Alphaproteobacteria bacterium]|nr:demethoxyubiquinone hydroxylase family protein [Alphaproteobacteria bacterium]
MTAKPDNLPAGPAYLPGDPPPLEDVKRMIRVDQAGEFGAVRIYEGQLSVLRKSACAPVILRMADQEKHHLETFDAMLVERQVRPTILGPLWRVAGFALGAATALMGEKAAMACTVAVEEVIDEHYQQQSERLSGDTHQDEPMLKSTIDEFRAEELQHRDTALGLGAADAVGYPVLSAVIKTGSRAAIWLSERF